jgi:hypothetical protein
MRDRRAVARYAGLTGSPDESGAQRREQGLARAGNARVRRGMIQLAWRFLMFQKESALAMWYRARTADSRSGTRKTMMLAMSDTRQNLPFCRAVVKRLAGTRIALSTIRRSSWLFSMTAELPIRGSRWRAN